MKFGLKKSKKDIRDFSYEKFFGLIDIKQIPDEFDVSTPLEIKNQKDTFFCFAFAAVSVSEDQEKVILDPLYNVAKTSQIMNKLAVDGADLRSVCKSLVKFGSIEKGPYDLSYSYEFIANWFNWNSVYDKLALEHKKSSYFKIDNKFDNIRIAMWQHQSSILTGCDWRESWLNSPKGIIGVEESPVLGGHAVKCFGVKKIGNKLYLKIQNSYGIDVGDNGIFYFPKEVIERDFNYGMYMFVDEDPNEVKKSLWNFKQKFFDFLLNFIGRFY